MFFSHSNFSRYIAVIIVLAVAVFWIFSDARDNEFVWDDKYFIVQLPDLRQADSVVDDVLLKRFFISDDYYRPLPLLSFYLQARSGIDPRPFHDLNVIIHIANTLLVFAISLLLISRSRLTAIVDENVKLMVAGALGAVYAFHPAMAEAVIWVSGRFDLMMTLFLLLAIFSDCAIKQKSLRALTVSAFFLLAAFSKEAAVGFCLALPVFHLVSEKYFLNKRVGIVEIIRDHFFIYFSLVIAGIVYLWVRYESLGYLLSGMRYNDYGTVLQKILLSCKAAIGYLKIAVIPFVQVSPIHYERFPIAIGDLEAWGALVALVLLSILAVVVIWKNKYWPVMGLVIFFLAIIPALHLFQSPLTDNLVQERYLQFPLALLLVVVSPILAAKVSELATGALLMVGAFATIVLFSSIMVVRSLIPLWSNDLALWSWITATSPELINGWLNLANARYENGDILGAKDALARADDRAADYGKVYEKSMILVTGGLIDVHESRPEDAMEKFLKVLESSDPRQGGSVIEVAHNNAFSTLLRMKELEAAEWYMINGQKMDDLKSLPQFVMNVGIYWYLVGDLTKARDSFSRGLSLMPESEVQANTKVYIENLLAGKVEFNFF